ncbi:A/G-specific adenine glycosylase [Leptospira perolatii]|uniref:Adenine DNA glycosylase n=1 Tax=Leptospira perolatii TaxID=2023191 RepID=A0A2M9ZMR7_9LEPT|nr:A/G-specific adenine glycosylase [Leptospira perolatii]PJZ73327.1 A/G-specific adenine glycosylase [Leptospira perolatii]
MPKKSKDSTLDFYNQEALGQTTKQRLRDWFYKEKRDLPFRKNRTPYSTWVSEIMLQQTRVNAMLPLYERFMERFPNMGELASSDEEEVLRYWKGLGYYSRAKNLHKGVKKIQEEYDGVFPKTLEEALSVPGVGPYTARAILSISYQLPFAVLDGNAKRVLSRLALFDQNSGKKSGEVAPAKVASINSDSILQKIADRFLDQNFPGDHNEAVMELGARICLPVPICSNCPLQADCLAFREGKQNDLLEVRKKNQEVRLGIRFLLVRGPSGILLLRTPKRRFFKTIYSLPYHWEGESPYNLDPILVKSESARDLQIQFSHTITHHKITGYLSEMVLNQKEEHALSGNLEELQIDVKWCDWNHLETEFPSSISRKILKEIGSVGDSLFGLNYQRKKK